VDIDHSARGERLRRALAVRQVQKQMTLAAELKVDESAISRWQRGAGLSITHAGRLCEVLDISLDWLILGRGDMDLHHRSQAPDTHSQPPHLQQKIVEASLELSAPIIDAINNLILVVGDELNSKRQS
jgi:plasmid maintenance system antidote protein VapI